MEILDNERREKKIDSGPKAMDSLLDEPIITLEEFFRDFENRNFPVVGDGFINLYSKNFELIDEKIRSGSRVLKNQVEEIKELLELENGGELIGEVCPYDELINRKIETPTDIIKIIADCNSSIIAIPYDAGPKETEELVKLNELEKKCRRFIGVIKSINEIIEKNGIGE